MNSDEFETMSSYFAFCIGERVEFDNKIGKDEGVVTGILFRAHGAATYAVTWSDKKESHHFSFELKTKA